MPWEAILSVKVHSRENSLRSGWKRSRRWSRKGCLDDDNLAISDLFYGSTSECLDVSIQLKIFASVTFPASVDIYPKEMRFLLLQSTSEYPSRLEPPILWERRKNIPIRSNRKPQDPFFSGLLSQSHPTPRTAFTRGYFTHTWLPG